MPRKFQRTVVKRLIDAVADAQIEAILPTFLPIDARGTLEDSQWANELHPTYGGFNKLAKQWRTPLKQLGVF